MLTPRSRSRRYSLIVPAAALLVAGGSHVAPLRAQSSAAPADSAETRAVAYLASEVPRWRREHPCYSCHNNGDAARALMAATARGYAVGPAIGDTLAWLAQPERWDANELRGSEDLPLARVQFAAALSATAAIRPPTAAALDAAAVKLLAHQHRDGSWRLSETAILGGPTFYSTALATALARASIAKADASRMREPLSRADAWLRAAPVAVVLDASAVLLGLGDARDSGAETQRARALDVLRRGQAPDGGWGPYVTSPSEPFDTALALLALAPLRTKSLALSLPFAKPDLEAAVDRGREYLLRMQGEDGSWPETTRPPGGESYAQRISTSAWALLALFATR
jgi:hypothetical protein